MIAPHVMLAGGNHRFSRTDIPILEQGDDSVGIRIGNDVWIGANAVVLDGVSIGNGAVVGAGSVVTQNVPEFAVVVGVPARIRSWRNGAIRNSVEAL
jgi:acetyltransferase-like isoleucine patch superfamily enzyme